MNYEKNDIASGTDVRCCGINSHRFPGENAAVHQNIRRRISVRYIRSILMVWLITSLPNAALFCQPAGKKISLKDSLDNAFDLSDYIIDANGFVPVPFLITDQSLGGFGGALLPVFIRKRPAYTDMVNGKTVRTPVAPDITGFALAYTLNNTWAAFGFRSGTFIKSRIKYTIAAGYANVNMSFYRTIESIGEKTFEFNFTTIPLFLQATKRIGPTRWYAGLKYL